MSATIDTRLNDAEFMAGLARMRQQVQRTMAEISAQADRSANQWVKYSQSTYRAGQQSAEGLGFVTSALGSIHPQLALVGEQTIKQLPTLMKYGAALGTLGVVGGGVAATAGALLSMAHNAGQLNKESIGATSALMKLFELIDDFSAGRKLGGGKRFAGEFGLDLDELRQQVNPARWAINEGASGDPSGEAARQFAADRRRDERQRRFAIDASGVDSAKQVDDLINAETRRIEALAMLDAQKKTGEQKSLTPQALEDSATKVALLTARYQAITSQLELFRGVAEDVDNEERDRWISEIKSSDEAKAKLTSLVDEVARLNETEGIGFAKASSALREANKLRERKNQLLAEEQRRTQDNINSIKEQQREEIKLFRDHQEAQAKKRLELQAFHAEVMRFAAERRKIEAGGMADAIGAQGRGGDLVARIRAEIPDLEGVRAKAKAGARRGMRMDLKQLRADEAREIDEANKRLAQDIVRNEIEDGGAGGEGLARQRRQADIEDAKRRANRRRKEILAGGKQAEDQAANKAEFQAADAVLENLEAKGVVNDKMFDGMRKLVKAAIEGKKEDQQMQADIDELFKLLDAAAIGRGRAARNQRAGQR